METLALTQHIGPRSSTPFGQLRRDNYSGRLSVNPVVERVTTIIDIHTTIEGSLNHQHGMKIDGRIFGDVTFGREDGLLIVSRDAIVNGNISGPRALILGEVEGSVSIPGVLVLSPTAKISGDITCGHLLSHKGAEMNGSIRVDPALLE